MERESFGEGDRQRNVLNKKEHIVLVDVEHGSFIGEFMPENGTGKEVAEGVRSKLIEKGIPIERIQFIIGDSTNSNTGYKEGSFSWFEEVCGKTFQWTVCIYHLLELPLRKIVQNKCGETSGPGSFKAGLGKKLQEFSHVKKAANFKKINCTEFPIYTEEEIKKELSHDQALFYRLCLAAITGVFENLEGRKLGPMSHSRWLTLGQWIIAMYLSTASPSEKLRVLAEFTIKCYAAIWFKAKKNPRATDTPIHVFKWMKQILTFDKETQDIVKPIFENGAYYFHSENLLLAALADERKTIREKAVSQILKIRNDMEIRGLARAEQRKIQREKKCQFKRERIFIKPKPMYEANDYIEFTAESERKLIYEPPYTQNLTDEELSKYVETRLDLDICNNSVLTERIIRDMTDVATKSTSASKREAMIHSIREHRQSQTMAEQPTSSTMTE